ncbi:MAG: HK97 gp10 family phage protein [Methanosarcina sp.]|nr:HK97 gp10 family phage protein [Methanosarcina sp.]
MADGIKIEIKGISELQNAFKALDQDIQGILSDAVSQGAAVVERSAKQKVRVKTGNLRNSIGEMKKTSSSTRVESQVGTDVEYGPANEFGTRRMPAQPYLRPAIDENEAQIKAAIEQAISSRLGGFR